MPRKLIFKMLSAETDSACVALKVTPDANPEFVGIVAKNSCGWAMYDTSGGSVTDTWSNKAELQKALAKEMGLDAFGVRACHQEVNDGL
jgi:hypothetical protein